jgi:hypothetical protein
MGNESSGYAEVFSRRRFNNKRQQNFVKSKLERLSKRRRQQMETINKRRNNKYQQ